MDSIFFCFLNLLFLLFLIKKLRILIYFVPTDPTFSSSFCSSRNRCLCSSFHTYKCMSSSLMQHFFWKHFLLSRQSSYCTAYFAISFYLRVNKRMSTVGAEGWEESDWVIGASWIHSIFQKTHNEILNLKHILKFSFAKNFTGIP